MPFKQLLTNFLKECVRGSNISYNAIHNYIQLFYFKNNFGSIKAESFPLDNLLIILS